jgi:ABC-type uncharacterized transport system permease subunit
MFIFGYFEIGSLFTTVPIDFFPQEIRKFFYFIASIFYGGYSTLFLFGRISVLDLMFYSLLLISISLFIIFMIILIWHYGLKRYEAYG